MKKSLRLIMLIFIVLGLFIAIPRLLPQIFYKNHISYKDYKVFSNEKIDANIYHILDSTIVLTSNDLLPKARYSYKVFLCNSGFLYRLHTIFWKMSTGSSDYITNNIFIAYTNLADNWASYFNNPDATKRRSIQSTIAHEQTHIVLRETYGLFNYAGLVRSVNWKIEGFCEWIAFNGIPIDYKNIQKIVKSGEYINNPFQQYRLSRFAVNFLISNKNYNLKELMDSNDSIESILEFVRISEED